MTGPELAKHIGVTYRQVDYWTRMGWIFTTDETHEPGSGRDREYEPEEVANAEMMALLVTTGFRPDVAARLVWAKVSLGWSLGRTLNEARGAV